MASKSLLSPTNRSMCLPNPSRTRCRVSKSPVDRLPINRILWLLVCAFSVPFAYADETPTVQVNLKREGDRVQTSIRDKHVVISIRSESGIGQALLERTSDQWPESIIVRLHLNGLEKLSIRNDDIRLEAALSSHDGMVRVWKRSEENLALDPTSPYWMDIRTFTAKGEPTSQVPLHEGYIDVPLPRGITVLNPKTITLNWVDFFR
jgi:hypothetical protein